MESVNIIEPESIQLTNQSGAFSSSNEDNYFTFPDTESFEKWRKDEGEEKGFNFIFLRSNKLNDGKKSITYACHRSGKKRIRINIPLGGESGKVRPIQKDSAKVSCSCRVIAKMEANGSNDTSISVRYTRQHSNHNLQSLRDLGKLRHTKESIEKIQDLIGEGLNQHALSQHLLMDEVELDNILEGRNIPKTNNFFTKDDLYHLVSAVHRQKYCKDNNEFKSIKLWKRYLEEKDFFIYYQDPIENRLGFAFGFVSKWQLQLLRDEEIGSTICLDSTHGTNSNKMLLYSIVVKNRSGTGTPCAFLITQDKSQNTLELWLRTLRDIGMKPKFVMIDISDVEASAISRVYGLEITIYYCWFHVKQAWNRQVKSKLGNVHTEEALHDLNGLLYAESLEELNNKTISFTNKWQEFTEFFSYINNYFFSRFPRWSKSYRSTFHGRIDTNNYIESWHRTLKYYFMKNKPNRRLDRLVYILSDIVISWHRQVRI